MRHHRIVAQISLILYILNLVLAAPVGVQGTHETPGDETDASDGENAAATDAVGSPHQSSLSEESISSGYPTPPSSPTQPPTGSYSWLLERPQRPSLNLQTSLYGSVSHPSGPTVTPGSLPELMQQLPPLFRPLSLGPAQVPPPQLEGPEQHAHEAMPAPPPAPNAPSPEVTESVHSHDSMPGESVPGTPSFPAPPPSETSQNNAEFFDEKMMKKLKIVAGVVILGGVVAGVVEGSRIEHHGRD